MLQSLSKQDFLLEVPHTSVYSNSVQKQNFCFKQKSLLRRHILYKIWVKFGEKFQRKKHNH